MTLRLMLQNLASLLWIGIPATTMNFNDSSINFLDMHRLALGACQVINQWPTLLFQSPVLTCTVTLNGNRMKVIDQACGLKSNTNSQWAPHGTRPRVSRTSVQHMSAQLEFTHTSHKAHRAVGQYLTPLILPQQVFVMHNFALPLQFSLKTWHYREHGTISKLAVMRILTIKEKWNLITSSSAVWLQSSVAHGILIFVFMCIFKFCNNWYFVHLCYQANVSE